MSTHNLELLRGTLDLLILKALALGPMHGLGVSQRIEQITQGAFVVQPGSLFPALHRLQEKGWLKGEWGESENRRRARFYRVTDLGQSRLETEEANWEKVVFAVSLMLEAN